MRKNVLKGLLRGLVGYAIVVSTTHAATFNEIGDAGQLTGTAQTVPAGTTNILGSIGTDQDIDLYQFGWGGGILTVDTFSAPQLDDPQLFLFDGAGNGIGENDDASGVQSRITLNLGAGNYFVGISFYDNDPLNASANDIFQFPGFVDLAGDFIQAPTGAGGPLLSSWVNRSSGSGTYNISFGGSTGPIGAVPLPAALPLFLSGLAGLGFIARGRERLPA